MHAAPSGTPLRLRRGHGQHAPIALSTGVSDARFMPPPLCMYILQLFTLIYCIFNCHFTVGEVGLSK